MSNAATPSVAVAAAAVKSRARDVPDRWRASRTNAVAETISRMRKNENEASTRASSGSVPVPGAIRDTTMTPPIPNSTATAALAWTSQSARGWKWRTRLSVRTGSARNAANAANALTVPSAGKNRPTVEAAKTTNTAANTATTARPTGSRRRLVLADRHDQDREVGEVQREGEDVLRAS